MVDPLQTIYAWPMVPPPPKSSPAFPQANGESIQAVATQDQSDAQRCVVDKIVQQHGLEGTACISYLVDDVVIYGVKGGTSGACDEMVKPASKGRQLKTKKINMKSKGKEEDSDAALCKEMNFCNEISATESEDTKDTKKHPLQRSSTSPNKQPKV
jgi:hypothetical protein